MCVIVPTLMFIFFVSHLFTGNQSSDDKVDTEKQKILEGCSDEFDETFRLDSW